MKKYLKRIGALIMALAMVLTMSATVFAKTLTRPAPGDTATVTVHNVEPGATVTAYKVVEAEYDKVDKTFIGYKGLVEEVQPVPLAGQEGELASKVSGIAKKITDKVYQLTSEKLNSTSENPSTYQKELAAGSYVILISGSNSAAIYAPIYVSVHYTNDNGTGNGIEGGSVTLSDKETWAKKQDGVVPDKKIESAGSGNNSKETVTVGSTVEFSIEAKIPDYSVGYEQAVFTMTDTLSKGLNYVPNSVQWAWKDQDGTEWNLDNALNPGDIYNSEERTLTFDFQSDYIIKHPLQDIVIKYSATVNEDAATGFDPNTNTVKVKYTTTPDVIKDSVEKKTYNYTFDITGGLLTKTEVDGVETLGGAKFGLFTDEKCTVPATYVGDTEPITATSANEDGNIEFKRLDEGTYYLKEIEAPADYQISGKIFKIDIVANMNKVDGTLQSYTVTVTDMDTNESIGNTFTSKNDKVKTPVTIKNTHLSALPSTGGIGTYIFTIVGVVIMAVMAGMFFVKRRQDSVE